MNRASVLAFGITAAVLAAATWNESNLTADEETAAPPISWVVGDMTITVEKRAVETIDGLRDRLILAMCGKGKGSLSLKMEELGGNPMSRVATSSTVAWERTIAFDQEGGTTETDLGALPGSQTKGEANTQKPMLGASLQLLASTDGTSYVMIWSQQPSLELLIEGLKDLPAPEVAKSDE